MTLCVAIVIGFTAAFSAIYTFIGLLNDRRSVSAITISAWLILVLVAGFLGNALSEPEFNNPIRVFQGGVEIVGDLNPNPHYISGLKRAVYEFLIDLLPAGQADSLQNILLNNPLRMLLCSAFVTAAATLGGLRLFERKDLK